MAIVVRRYALVGPNDAMLARFVHASSVVVGTYPYPTLDIEIDDATPDITTTLDEYMATLGFALAATSSAKQVFRYTATGLEGNPFTVTLPLARATANYNVQVTMGGPQVNPLLLARALVATFTVNDFEVEVSAIPLAGDEFMFTVEDLI